MAVLREEENAASSQNANEPHKRKISKLQYDYFHRPIEGTSDGDWQITNMVDHTTGLWYDPDPTGADWCDLLPQLLEYAYSSALANSTLTDHPLLLVERAYNPPPIRQQALEILFEECQVPAAFLAKDAVLSCYACGRTTATVVDIGYSGTTVAPVHEGFVETVRRSPVGVREMDEMILKHLDQLKRRPVLPLYQVKQHKERSPAFHQAARLFLAQECREMGAGAAVNTTAGSFQAPQKPFDLPDGSTIEVPSAQRFAVSGLLFGKDSQEQRDALVQKNKTEMQELMQSATDLEENEDDERYTEAAAVGVSKRKSAKKAPPFSNRVLQKACIPYMQTQLDRLSAAPLASMVCDTVYQCDRDQQAALLGNVILGGGGSLLGPTEQAVPETLKEQMEALIHTHTPGWRVKMLAPSERGILSWLGGSILGSIGTFHDMWITKDEYEDWGTAIVNRKCP